MKKAIRQEVHQKYNGHCGYCGCELKYKDMQVDHVIPQGFYLCHIKNNNRIPKHLAHLGEDDMNHIDNLMPACRVCNKWKSDHDLEQFRIELEAQVERTERSSSNFRMAVRYGQIIKTPKPIIFFFETCEQSMEHSTLQPIISVSGLKDMPIETAMSIEKMAILAKNQIQKRTALEAFTDYCFDRQIKPKRFNWADVITDFLSSNER